MMEEMMRNRSHSSSNNGKNHHGRAIVADASTDAVTPLLPLPMTSSASDDDKSKRYLTAKKKDNNAPSKATVIIFTSILIVFLIIFIYWYCTSEEYVTPERVAEWSEGKTIVITGANSVVSTGVLVHLLRANTAEHIILTCRSKEKCQDTLHQVQQEVGVPSTSTLSTKISIVTLDLTSPSSIRDCAEEIEQSMTELSNQEGHHQQQQSTNGNNNIKNMILVWNANDSVHDPIRSNGWGHLHLTHLLYPHVQRIVICASIVGGWPWNVLQPWDQTSPSYPEWFQGVAQYGTSKRTMLFLAQELLQQGRKDTSTAAGMPPLQVIATQAGLTCDDTELCAMVSMTPVRGAHSHLRAMLDPDLVPGAYVGHRWLLWGKTIIAGTLESSWYHLPLSKETRTRLWTWSLSEGLGISDGEFGMVPTL